MGRGEEPSASHGAASGRDVEALAVWSMAGERLPRQRVAGACYNTIELAGVGERGAEQGQACDGIKFGLARVPKSPQWPSQMPFVGLCPMPLTIVLKAATTRSYVLLQGDLETWPCATVSIYADCRQG